MCDTTIYQGQPVHDQNEKKNAENVQPVEESKKSDTWKRVGLGAAGVAVGAGAAYAASSLSADEPTQEPQQAEQPKEEAKTEPKPEPKTEPKAEPQDNPYDKMVTGEDIENFKVDGADIVGAGKTDDGHIVVGYDVNDDGEADIALVDKDDSGDISAPDVIVASDGGQATVGEIAEAALQEEPNTSEPLVTTSNVDTEGFEVEGVRIVGTDTVDDHIAVAYDTDNDDNPDIAIIDIDDSGDISAPDVVMDTEGNMATVGDIYQAAMEQNDSDAIPAVNEDPSLAQNPDVAPDMPDYMNDAVVDA